MKGLAAYQWLTSCSGMELQLLPDGRYNARLCKVSIHKDQLDIGEKREKTGDLKTVMEKLEVNDPLAVTITGKGIVVRKTSRIEQLTQESLNQVFPNLAATDFYIQNFISGVFSFLALIRKDILDKIIEELSAVGCKVLTVSLGPFVLKQVLAQFNTYGDQVQFDGHNVQYDKDRNWTDYKYVPGSHSDFPLKAGNEPMPEQFILAYASAFQLVLYNNLEPVSVSSESINQELEEFREEKKFKFRLAVSLGVFFVLLLVNFLLFNWYSGKNDMLLSQVNRHASGETDRRNLEKEAAEKEALLQELGWNRGFSYAYLCDQAGQTVPQTVLLTELTVNPQKNKEDRGIREKEYEQGQIRISGKTNDLQAVNSWIYMLREKKWVERVVLENYMPDNEKDGSQQFTLRIFMQL